MLSKVAERVYWTARYLERIESTARLITIYDKLLFDLPRSVSLSWYNLISINSLQSDFDERFSVRDERNVVKFMLGDSNNPCSVVSSLAAIRENVRTTRDVVLQETWELTNELNLYVQENLQQGINRSKRYEFLDTIIKGCQQIHGLLYGNMPHDAAWWFLRLGRNLERADMTTRNLDAGAAAVLEVIEDDTYVRQIIWGTVLRSLNAEQGYRRTVRGPVSGSMVANYLLLDANLPRSIEHCFISILDSCEKLPQSQPLVEQLKHSYDKLSLHFDGETNGAALRAYLNELQIYLAKVHTDIRELWFPKYS
ncbi:alpha-E domain-containing protein [Agaribacterium haliotis]|uniref:alpha-E domain-containing protein n=1 Tax=Agaribacterium haliotis TaxID=2013869 RepID=UPI000BB53748|nr:alpha-E domain-containing protein [Agaribacterium haliotis]